MNSWQMKQVLILASGPIQVPLRRHISGQLSKHLLNETFLYESEKKIPKTRCVRVPHAIYKRLK